MHGFGIGRWIEPLSGNELRIEEGSLYPALYRIEKKGWVDASWGVSENQRRAKFYRLTAEGRRQLARNADTWSSFAHAVARVLGAKQHRRHEQHATLASLLRFWGSDPGADVDEEFAFHLKRG